MLKWLILFLMISIPSLAQSTKFQVHTLSTVNNITSERDKKESNVMITVSNYNIKFSSGEVYDFIGDYKVVSAYSTWTLAKDAQNKQCKISFTTENYNDWLITVEYDSVSKFYYCVQI